MHLVDYLARQARRITDGAPHDAQSLEAWQTARPRRLAQYLDWLGLADLPPVGQRPPLHAAVTGTLERDGYRVEKIHFQSLPRLYVAGNLYVPTGDVPARMPAVLYLCGHHGDQKIHYQAHARRFAQLGFVALALDTIQYGEVFGFHTGTYHDGWWQWYSRGYTPAGVEALNAIRALDLLQSLPYVDGTRLGATGISGGGSVSVWLAAADERVGCIAPACCTGTQAGHVIDRTLRGHCDCVMFHNPYNWDQVDISALVAPRPSLICSANRDVLFSLAAIREHYERLKRVYELYGAGDHLRLLETPGPHSYDERSRTAIFSWFLRHLAGREVPPEEVGDIEPDADEPAEALKVFWAGVPPDDVSTTIQDTFIRTAAPPDLDSEKSLAAHRARTVAALRAHTFAALPQDPPPLDARVTFELDTGLRRGIRITYRSEADWHGELALSIPPQAAHPAPVVVTLHDDPDPWYTEGLLRDIPPRCIRANVAPRGTRESGWSPELAWFVRRAAAVTGWTVAAMRVWDLLRALEVIRARPEVDAERVALAASGEMAVPMLYAALLDGRISAIVLHDPPATQDAPGEMDGTGPMWELLNCLRFTDLPVVAGLLFPAELVFVGARPETYGWAEELYARLGGTVRHVLRLGDWNGMA